ncbi:amidohydrolase [Massilia putida]|uniref:amidohydrolase n=1 Tax=Massilia putida TaxID=1141883 RepID=UPI000A745D66|nr:amidohydrolase [Massilia putida]
MHRYMQQAARTVRARALARGLLLAAMWPLLPAAAALDDTDRDRINRYVDAQVSAIDSNAMAIWNLAEVGFQEKESSKLLQKTLHAHGFAIDTDVAGMPTAFVARYRTGPGPVIAILAEFDALPGLSQAAGQTRPVPAPGHDAAHGCGHNLLGSASVGAAIALRHWLADTGLKGEVRLYGAPAEEGGDGKVYMVRAGLFKDVDAVLHWHPGARNGLFSDASTAMIQTDFTFHGVSTHAAAAPERGRSALAGMELMDVAVNYMRQFTPDGTRIHGVVVNGGLAPNVIPDVAKSSYYVRNADVRTLQDLQARLLKTAQGAAMATGTTVTWELEGGSYPILPNQVLSDVAYANLAAVAGTLRWNKADADFAHAIQSSLNVPGTDDDVGAIDPPQPSSARPNSAFSTDVGDISYVVPTVGFVAATWPQGAPAHSWAAAAASGSSIGVKGAVVAARAIALTGADLILNPDVLAKAKAEMDKRRGPGFEYAAMFGDRAPPLNYRRR